MKIALVADRNTVTFFKLAGLKDAYSANTGEKAKQLVEELSERSDLAIILIAQRFADRLQKVTENLAERKYPLILPIPDTEGPVTVKSDPIVELIRRKAGIEVKL